MSTVHAQLLSDVLETVKHWPAETRVTADAEGIERARSATGAVTASAAFCA